MLYTISKSVVIYNLELKVKKRKMTLSTSKASAEWEQPEEGGQFC